MLSHHLTVTLTQYMHSPGFLLSQKNTLLPENRDGGPHSFLATDSIWERSLIKSVWLSNGQKHLCWSENLLQSPSRQEASSGLDTTRVRKVMSPLGWKGWSGWGRVMSSSLILISVYVCPENGMGKPALCTAAG